MSSERPAFPYQREHYRVEYPRRVRPRFIIRDREFEVLDCSESGLRFKFPRNEVSPRVGDPIAGVVRFPREEVVEVDVEGQVVRTGDGFVAVQFTEARILFGIMLDEQRYVRARYPAWS